MRGFILSMDAMVAVGVLLMLAAFLSVVSFAYTSPETQYQRDYYIGKDILNVMKNTKMADIWDYQIVDEYLSLGYIDEGNKNYTVMDMVGHFWSSGNSSLAANLTEAVISPLMPSNKRFQILIDDDAVYTVGSESGSSLSRLDSVASGFSRGQITSGYSTKAFLTQMAKSVSSYAYFGGFEGEGNLTKRISLQSLDTVIEAVMELDVAMPFTLYVNGQPAGSYTPSLANKTEDSFTICNQSFQPAYCSLFTEGINTVQMNFSTLNITDNYVGGGLLRVTYRSTEPIISTPVTEYNFPGINGFLNLYSSFSIPGNLKGMTVYLHFDNAYDTYLRLGNVTVYNGSGGYTEVLITNQSLYGMMNYSDISNMTVPLRFGTEAKDIIAGGNADVVLINDVSSSMEYMLNESSPGVERDCDDPLIDEYTTERLSLAKCLAKEFVNHILNFTGNRAGLIAYSGVPSYIAARNVVTIRKTSRGLTENQESLNNQIEAFSAEGATGICGSLREARQMLETQSDDSRMKFIVLMSDGLPNVQCDPTPRNENITRGCINYVCPWYWMDRCYERDDCLYLTCGEYISDLAAQDAIDDACKAHQRLNATIYSIGFGPVGSCTAGNETLNSISECGDGEFSSGMDALSLREVYTNISRLITTLAYQAQEVEKAEIETDSTLYPDSRITLEYDSFTPSPQYGEITFNLEGPDFGGTITSPQIGSVYIKENSTLLNAKVISYSSEHWTDHAKINNSILGGWHEFFSLDDFGTDYTMLGDPFEVMLPISLVAEGNNTLSMDTATSPNEPQGGSPYDKAVFSIARKAFVGYGQVFPRSSGSTREIWYDINQDGVADGSTMLSIGSGSDSWDPESDSLDDALLRLLDELNFISDSGENDGSFSNPVDVSVVNVLFDSGSITRVPGMWGPVKIEVRVWGE